MSFSQQTLSDCLLTNKEGNPGPIAQLFNFTRTDGGHKQLMAFFSDRKKSREEIASTQDMLLHIFPDLKRWDLGLSNSDVFYLNEYFRFEKKLMRNEKRISRIKVLLKKQPDIEFVKIGVKRLFVFLTDLQKKIVALESTPNPGLHKKLQLISGVFKIEQIREFLQADIHNLSRYETIKSDNYLRFAFKPLFYQVLETIYELEALFSLAKAVNKYKLQFPVISGAGQFSVEGAWNPLIKKCVKNSFAYETGKNLVFLTGPNMSGKSTFLRTIGLIVCLAHAGMAVPAEKAIIPFFDEVNVSITIEDNLEEGYSQFYSELQTVKSVALGLREGKTCFTIFDELFRGTNLADATACSGTLVRGFQQFKDSFFIISSHHIQLIGQAEEPNGIQFNYIEASIENDEPKFSYALCAGISELHLGRYLFKKEGIDEILSAG